MTNQQNSSNTILQTTFRSPHPFKNSSTRTVDRCTACHLTRHTTINSLVTVTLHWATLWTTHQPSLNLPTMIPSRHNNPRIMQAIIELSSTPWWTPTVRPNSWEWWCTNLENFVHFCVCAHRWDQLIRSDHACIMRYTVLPPCTTNNGPRDDSLHSETQPTKTLISLINTHLAQHSPPHSNKSTPTAYTAHHPQHKSHHNLTQLEYRFGNNSRHFRGQDKNRDLVKILGGSAPVLDIQGEV